VARDFDLTETAVREWVKQAERDAGTRGDGLTSSEREELAYVAVRDVERALSNAGLVSFFYDAAAQSAWGFDPADHVSWAVMHTDAGIAREIRRAPDAIRSEPRFPAIGLAPHAELTFAPWESFAVETMGMTRDESFAYANIPCNRAKRRRCRLAPSVPG